MAQDMVLFSVAKRVATITLNRPGKRNALDKVVVKELLSLFEQCLEDKNIAVIVLSANGEHFCSGADIHWMQVVAQNSLEDNKKDAMFFVKLLDLIYRSPKPVIALTHGMAMGGGLGLIAAADIAIAADNAKFAFSEVKIGITPSIISPYILAAIGERAARYYFLTAEYFDAEEAHRLGLIHQRTSLATLEETGYALAQNLLQNSLTAMTAAKQLIHKVSTEKISPQLIEFTAEHLAKIRTTPEGHEGLLAFSEKRPPKWS